MNDSELELEAGRLLRRARQAAGLSLRALASCAATSHATVAAYEGGRKVPSVATFLRLLGACGYGVDVLLTPRVRAVEGFARGEELRQVLELADAFPAPPKQPMSYPRFGAP